MNVDEILSGLNAEEADYILIGGMNFLLRHEPELTFDVDVWVRDTPANLERVNRALQHLGAEWGPSERDWKRVSDDWRWLERQSVVCVTTTHGALDIFREVRGLEGRFDECRAVSGSGKTATGVPFASLSDQHMLACQEALNLTERKQRRMDVLRAAIRRGLDDQR